MNSACKATTQPRHLKFEIHSYQNGQGKVDSALCVHFCSSLGSMPIEEVSRWAILQPAQKQRPIAVASGALFSQFYAISRNSNGIDQ